MTEPVGRAFVGRTRELDELRTALADAISGRGALVLVSGEPGIGKTRLAAELVTRTTTEGAKVVWGRCWEGEGAPAFWPWVQLVRGLADASPAEQLRTELGTGAAHILQLVPELAQRLPDIPAPTTSLQSEHARFYLFDATTQFLKRAAQSWPLLFVLDDLHWADKPSLLLLDFFAREIAGAPVLLIATYREAEARQPGPLAETLASLSRLGRTLPLRGFDETEVAAFLERTAGAKPTPELVTTVHRATDGNPFFIDEITRLLVAEGITQPRGRNVPIPETVRAVIRRRIALLPETSRRVLAAASAVGRDFEASLLQRVSGLTLSDVGSALARAKDAGLVAPSDHASPRYAFAHALVRETLYEELPLVERQRLHGTIAEALDELHRAEPAGHLAELANHFFAAGPDGDSTKALDYCERAGAGAMAMYAYEEAAHHFDRALDVFARAGNDDARRAELLLSVATAFRRAGDDPRAREISARAGDLAKKLGDARSAARAALTFCRPTPLRVFGGDQDAIRLLGRALDGLGGEEDRLRAQVLARLALELQYSDHEGRAPALSAEAVEIARRLGDGEILSATLTAHGLMLWTSSGSAELVAIFTEALRKAEACGELELEMAPRRWLITVLLRRGDPAADLEIEKYAQAGDKLRQPFYQGEGLMMRGFRARICGRFADAEATIRTGSEIARQASATVSSDIGELMLFFLRVDQGRLAELLPTFEKWIDNIGTAYWRGVHRAFLYSELGHRAEAKREFERLAADGFSAERLFPYRAVLLGNLAQVCAYLGDARHAAALYELLLPYAGEALATPITPSTNGALVLGMLAATLSRFDDALRHFEESLVLSRRMEARPWAFRTQYEHAKALLARGAAGARDEAARRLGEAIAGAEEIGMAKLLADATALQRAELGGISVTPKVATSSSGRLRREGDYWSIQHEQSAFRLKDTKGLRYLAELLHNPGREFHVLDLVAIATGSAAREASGAPDLGDAGPRLDARAKLEYRKQLDDLRDDLEEAERFHDLGRAAKAREEMEFLGAELARATGLGGRDRSAGAAAERARLNVTIAIKSTLKKIAENDPRLGGHLAKMVKTGRFCSYEPDPRSPISWS